MIVGRCIAGAVENVGHSRGTFDCPVMLDTATRITIIKINCAVVYISDGKTSKKIAKTQMQLIEDRRMF